MFSIQVAFVVGTKFTIDINYNIDGAKPLKIENNEIEYKVPKVEFYILLRPLILFGFMKNILEHINYVHFMLMKKEKKQKNYLRKKEGKPEKHYFYQIFGSEEIENRGCPGLSL